MESLVLGVGTGRGRLARTVDSMKWASLEITGRGDGTSASLC